jgi:hypothetical protein
MDEVNQHLVHALLRFRDQAMFQVQPVQQQLFCRITISFR